MRTAVLTGLVACTLIFGLGSASASAEEHLITNNNEDSTSVIALLSTGTTTALEVLENVPAPIKSEAEIEVPETKHVIAESETLSKIAEHYQTTWQRLFYKNTFIVNPDIIEVGKEIVIPRADEELAERELPPAPVPVVRATARTSTASIQSAPAVRGSSSGNGYVAGYCTWYVKNKRPDLPNNLGNAISWVSRAAAQGMATGSTPVAGAVGQRGNHVVYVESVNSDGTVNISEMNHKGLYVITNRTLPADYFSYIY